VVGLHLDRSDLDAGSDYRLVQTLTDEYASQLS
jgi:hypothetical protein